MRTLFCNLREETKSVNFNMEDMLSFSFWMFLQISKIRIERDINKNRSFEMSHINKGINFARSGNVRGYKLIIPDNLVSFK